MECRKTMTDSDNTDVEGTPTCNRDDCENSVERQYAVGKPDRYAKTCEKCDVVAGENSLYGSR